MANRRQRLRHWRRQSVTSHDPEAPKGVAGEPRRRAGRGARGPSNLSSRSLATGNRRLVEGEVHFADEDDRAAFMKEYLAAIGPLLKRYSARKGARYRALFAVYPKSQRDKEDER